MTEFVISILLIVAAYLCGSIPTGYWLAKAMFGIDIRQHGSGSTGATNVWRCVGKWPGIAVFFIDLFKGVLPVRLAIWLGDSCACFNSDIYRIIPVAIALAALIGHSKSVFLNFSGGKSAATGLGTLLALQPLVGTATFLTWCCIVSLTRIVSLASILATASCGIYMAISQAPISYIVYCILGFAYVTYRHKANIDRMLEGTEPRLGSKNEAKNESQSESGKQTEKSAATDSDMNAKFKTNSQGQA
jgi:glycerol-3-phosphate acyltransferase PlsY